MNKIDLHIHTNASLEADYSPTEIINMAKAAKLEVIAIADHDTAAGVKEATEAGVKKNVKVIPAIEISCVYKDISLHILGYGIDTDNPKYEQIFKHVMSQDQQASQKRLQLIKDMGIYVNMEKLKPLIQNDIIIGEIIGEASIHEPENKDNPLIKPFLEDGHLSDNPYVNFYWEYCAQGKPAYVEMEFLDLKEVIKILKDDNALAVFAHPGNNIQENQSLLYEIMNCGLDGIEVYSSYHNQGQIDFYKKHAKLNNWLITCGSDFHGRNKPKIKLGQIDISKKQEATLINTVTNL